MAQGLISGNNTNNPSVARPTDPTINAATLNNTDGTVTVSYTPSVYGPTVNSGYVVIPHTNTAGAATPEVTTNSNSSVVSSGLTSYADYTFTVKAINAQGRSKDSVASSPVTIPLAYTNTVTYNSTANIAVPTGKTKMAAWVIQAGSSGSGGMGGSWDYPSFGGAGNGGSVLAYKGLTVTAGETFTITVGASGGGHSSVVRDTGAETIADTTNMTGNASGLLTASGGSAGVGRNEYFPNGGSQYNSLPTDGANNAATQSGIGINAVNIQAGGGGGAGSQPGAAYGGGAAGTQIGGTAGAYTAAQPNQYGANGRGGGGGGGAAGTASGNRYVYNYGGDGGPGGNGSVIVYWG